MDRYKENAEIKHAALECSKYPKIIIILFSQFFKESIYWLLIP